MAPTAIQRIHEAAKEAIGSSLDRPVWLDSDLALFGLVDFDSRKRLYVDVLVASVVALGRKDFWTTGDTWRSITHRLHGSGWPDAVFQYFESPTREEPFPAPGSNHQLRLLVYRGVAECSNGNHRLVAARAWLTRQHGDAAVLRGVRANARAGDFVQVRVANLGQCRRGSVWRRPNRWRHGLWEPCFRTQKM